MAIINNGVKNSLPTQQIPASGYVRPTITEVEDYNYKRELTLLVPKATVQNATQATTLANIINDVAVGLTKQIDDILANDYDATNNVTAHADFTKIKGSYDRDNVAGTYKFYEASAFNYVCTVILYVKIA